MYEPAGVKIRIKKNKYPESRHSLEEGRIYTTVKPPDDMPKTGTGAWVRSSKDPFIMRVTEDEYELF